VKRAFAFIEGKRYLKVVSEDVFTAEQQCVYKVQRVDDETAY
jgi:hypothetical protein